MQCSPWDCKDSWTTFSCSWSPAGKSFRNGDKDGHCITRSPPPPRGYICFARVMKSQQSMTECVILCILKTWMLLSLRFPTQASYVNPSAISKVPKACIRFMALALLESVARESFKQKSVTLFNSRSLITFDLQYSCKVAQQVRMAMIQEKTSLNCITSLIWKACLRQVYSYSPKSQDCLRILNYLNKREK